MAFKKLVRYLISGGEHGFLVKRLEGSIREGFKPTSDEPVTVAKVALWWTTLASLVHLG
jgi:hypothetical protein